MCNDQAINKYFIHPNIHCIHAPLIIFRFMIKSAISLDRSLDKQDRIYLYKHINKEYMHQVAVGTKRSCSPVLLSSPVTPGTLMVNETTLGQHRLSPSSIGV